MHETEDPRLVLEHPDELRIVAVGGQNSFDDHLSLEPGRARGPRPEGSAIPPAPSGCSSSYRPTRSRRTRRGSRLTNPRPNPTIAIPTLTFAIHLKTRAKAKAREWGPTPRKPGASSDGWFL